MYLYLCLRLLAGLYYRKATRRRAVPAMQPCCPHKENKVTIHGQIARSGLILTAGLALIATAALAQSGDEVPRDLGVYYEKEGVDLADYNSIILDTLGLEDARIVAPPWYEGEDRQPKMWSLTASDAKWLRKSYRETMTDEIQSKGGYPIVEEHGEGVLIIDIEVVYLMPYARKGENVQTRGFGEMLVQAQFRDGMTGELLAIYEGKQDVGSEYQQNTRLNNENRLLDLFQYWGGRVRMLMDKAHEG